MNWRVSRYIVTLHRGCFRSSATESLQRSNQMPSEEFEKDSGRENSSGSQRATVEFVVNSENTENEERISTELSGEAHANADPFPSLPQIPALLGRREGTQSTASVPIENRLIRGAQSESLGTTWEQTLTRTMQNRASDSGRVQRSATWPEFAPSYAQFLGPMRRVIAASYYPPSLW
jgi:hypothetical protein